MCFKGDWYYRQVRLGLSSFFVFCRGDFMSENKSAIKSKALVDKNSPRRFFNRQLSRLCFQKRLLEEADNKAHPLLERLRFLSLSGADLEAFYLTRVAPLRRRVEAGFEKLGPDGLAPKEQLRKVRKLVVELNLEQARIWARLRVDLAGQNFHIIDERELGSQDHKWLKNHFIENIFAVLTPIAVDPAHSFPFIANRGMTLGLELAKSGAADHVIYALVPLPRQLTRFILLPEKDGFEDIRFIRLETVVTLFINDLFPSLDVQAHGVFRLLRDSKVKHAKRAENLEHSFEPVLQKRRHGEVILLEFEQSTARHLRRFIVDKLQVGENKVQVEEGMVGLLDFSQLIVKDRADLLFAAFTPRYPERLRAQGGDIFSTIGQKEFIVHHPYESLNVVLHFLRQAVNDPDIVSIKWMLDQTSDDPAIIKALKDAAQSGTSVTAIMTLRNGSDKEAKMACIHDLESVGVYVLHGSAAVKTDAKLAQIMRREHGTLKSYIHIGTGNDHPVADKIYTDLSYFTDDPVLGRDVSRIFNTITGGAPPAELEAMSISPDGIRDRMIDHIREEIYHAKEGRPAQIWLKMNALDDLQIIDALYEASYAGVGIDLVIKGICRLRPGLAGLSENIRVKSVMGRFLEHSRIYCFGAGHGLPSDKSVVYISSADMVDENMDRQIEVMVPISGRRVHQKIMEQIMQAYLADNQQSWHILSDGVSRRFDLQEGTKAFNAHKYFMNDPSLSGRGKSPEERFPPLLKE